MARALRGEKKGVRATTPDNVLRPHRLSGLGSSPQPGLGLSLKGNDENCLL